MTSSSAPGRGVSMVIFMAGTSPVGLFAEPDSQRAAEQEQGAADQQDPKLLAAGKNVVADGQLRAHDPVKLGGYCGRQPLEGGLGDGGGHFAPEQGGAVDHRGTFHDRGDGVRQLADGQVDAPQKAHQRADDGAQSAPRAVALDQRCHQIHQRGVGEGVGGDHAHQLQVGEDGEGRQPLTDAVDLADQQGGGADDHRGDPGRQHIAGGDDGPADGGGIDRIELAGLPVLDHVGQAGLGDGDGVDADHAGAGPGQHQQLGVFLVTAGIAAGELAQKVCDAAGVDISQKEEHQHDDDHHGQQREEDRAFVPQVLLEVSGSDGK